MIVITLLGTLLAIIVKLALLLVKLSMSASTTAISAASRVSTLNSSKSVQMVQKASIFILKTLNRLMNAIISLFLFLWTLIGAVWLFLLGGLVIALFTVVQLTGDYQSSTSFSNAHKIDSPTISSSIDTSGKTLAPIASSERDIPKSLIANARWAMAHRPQGCYLYQQGNTDYCRYDCSTWTTALLEMSGWKYTEEGKLEKRTGDRYIISKNRKSDLHAYRVTSWNLLSKNSKFQKGQVTAATADSKLKPGDFLVNNSHIVLYVGKVNGQHTIVHASYPGSPLFADPERTQPVTDVGYGVYFDMSEPWTIFRFGE